MSGVQMPGQQRGLLDDLAKGVAIASTVYGIKQGVDKSNAEQTAMDRRAKGILNAGEQQELATKGAEFSDKPFDGGVPYYDEGGGLVGYVGKKLEPKIKAPNVKEVGGTLVQQDEKTGAWNPVYTAPAKPEKPETGTWASIGVDENGNAILHNSKTNATMVGPKLGTKPKDEKQPSDTQLGAAGFAKRAIAADEITNGLIGGGYDPTTAGAGIRNSVPLIGNFVRNDSDKSYNQAKKDFISAVLRKESGAAISEQEYANEDLKYFPQPGDTSDVIRQKAESRQRAIATLAAQAGPGLDKVADVPSSVAKKKPDGGTATAAPGDGKKNVVPAGTPTKPDQTVLDYAKAYDLDYQTAQSILISRGHKPQ